MSEDFDAWIRRHWRLYGVEIWGTGLEHGDGRRLGWKSIKRRFGWPESKCRDKKNVAGSIPVAETTTSCPTRASTPFTTASRSETATGGPDALSTGGTI